MQQTFQLARKHLGQLKSIEDQVPASASVYSSHSTSISLPDSGPVSEMTYTVSSGTLNPTIPYRTMPYLDSGLAAKREADCSHRTEAQLSWLVG